MNLSRLPALDGDGAVHVVIESPRGSAWKLKYDAKLQVMSVSRPLTLGLTYPFDWGFIPGTLATDNDPLDAMVISDLAAYPGVVIPCRPIGVVEIEQNSKRTPGERERNDRVLALPVKALRAGSLESALDLPERLRRELAEFFLQATVFEDKAAVVLGWGDAKAARALIERSVAAFAAAM